MRRRGQAFGWLAGLAAMAGSAGQALALEDVVVDPKIQDTRRAAMVHDQLMSNAHGQAITDERVLGAMRQVPRHEFVPAAHIDLAYSDQPVPIGEGQTISQPYIVALMTELADVQSSDRVLEIGTGSGYQAAVLAQLADEVYTIEILEPLAIRAKRTFAALGYSVHARTGDGFFGWPEAAPFDVILVTAAAPQPPEALLTQLREGGRMVMPIGDAASQSLTLFKRENGVTVRRRVIPVRFVPMTGAIQSVGAEH
jgi:protein-L-isoaspartate(D-aspartate) O-methyltransferase